MKFIDKVVNRLDSIDSMVCVGLDSRYDRIPEYVKKGRSVSEAILEFNKQVVSATHEYAAAIKANVSFYAGFGAEGLEGLRLSNDWIKSNFPDIQLLADCKRSEMGLSVNMVKHEIFEWLKFDCVMVTPWFGFDTIRDYLDDEENGVCVYVHDSNPTAVEVQDLELKDGRRVYEAVTQMVVDSWNPNGNVFVEAGATYPQQLQKVREIVGEDMVIVTAGIGAQGGKTSDIDSSVFGTHNRRMLVNSSRGIIFAGENEPDYFKAVGNSAKKLRDELREVSG